MDRHHIGCIRFGKNESPEHRKEKISQCEELFGSDLQFITEAHIEGKIADIVILDWNEIIEIVKTESPESIEKKREFYVKKGFRFKFKRV